MAPVLFLAGGAALILGAELLVRGAARLALAVGLTPLVVGLTVVAFGTSSPELAVTVGAGLVGQGELAVGNVVGSNIFNVLFILGVSALIAPLVVSHQLVRLDVPIMIGASVLGLILGLDGRIGQWEGAALVGGVVAYTAFLLARGRRGEEAGATGRDADTGKEEGTGDPAAQVAPHASNRFRWVLDLVLIGAGLLLLVVGARWLVQAAVDTAVALGVSELVVGLTIVAAGTSLPEVATSILASIRGQRDIAVGNVVGSNIFNLLAVLGLGSAVAPGGIPVSAGALSFDIPVMIGVAVATLPIFFTGFRIARWEGLAFIAFFCAYTLYLVLNAVGHAAADELGTALLFFVAPLAALTLATLSVRALRDATNPPQ